MKKGKIVAGALAPHPPHLVYAENAPQNEPKAQCGWETLRWAYRRLRQSLDKMDYDVLIVHSPHWRTNTGTHILGLPQFKGLSVDPIFPNLFRYNYDLKVDVELAERMGQEAQGLGLEIQMMRNPNFRIDYGTIISCHLANPLWNKPIIGVSAVGAARHQGMGVMQELMFKLGQATRKSVEDSGRRAVLLASSSLSHLHFTSEAPIPEDMSHEHVTSHHQYMWDMKMIDLMEKGKAREIVDILPEFTEQTKAETDSGSLTWMLAALDFPTYPAEVHGYGTVIGTGNAVVEWREERA